MNLRFTRRSLLITGIITSLFAVAAFAEEIHVIGFASSASVNAGQATSVSVQVNQVPMSVTITSNPPGLVNYTAMVTSTTQSLSVPTNAGAPAGNYTLKAMPTAGGAGQSHSVIAAPPL